MVPTWSFPDPSLGYCPNYVAALQHTSSSLLPLYSDNELSMKLIQNKKILTILFFCISLSLFEVTVTPLFSSPLLAVHRCLNTVGTGFTMGAPLVKLGLGVYFLDLIHCCNIKTTTVILGVIVEAT